MMSNIAGVDISLPGIDPDMAAPMECVYKATAQVMSRDEGTRLWRPLHGGGMSVVELSRVPAASDDVTDDEEAYYVIGRKENDLVLFCVVSDDLTYTRATPTFHHWQTGSCSYGLTFRSPSEADTFAKAVDRSVEAIRHKCRPEEVELLLTSDNEPQVPKDTREAETVTVVVDIEQPVPDTETESAEVTVASCEVALEKSDSASAVEENLDIRLSELEQALPKLPPKLSQVLPRPVLSRSRPTGSQSFSAAPPRPPAVHPKLVHRTQSSATPALPPVPPRAPRTATTTFNNQSTLFSLQQPAATSASSNVVVPHPVSLFSHASPDAGTTFNYVYFTEGAVPPATQLAVSKNRKHQHPQDASLFGGKHADIGKKLADGGFGAVNTPSSEGYDTNPAGSYVRLAVTSPPQAVDPLTLHDYCYPSIDAIVPAPTASVCRIEPQHSPPPLPTKSRRVGWWDCRWRRQRARSSQLRATWSQRSTTYGTELSVAPSHLAITSLNNSQSSSLCTRRPSPAWRSTLLCFVRTCIRPCRWRRRCRQIRRLGLSRGHESVTGHL